MNKKVLILAGLIILAFIIVIVANPTKIKNDRKDDSNDTSTQDSVEYESRIDVNSEKVKTSSKLTELTKETVLESNRENPKTAASSSLVKVNYIGWLASTGEVFQSSLDYYPDGIEFTLGELIKGWNDGIVGMKEGEVTRLFIPSDQAYGANANGGIPANSDLIFDIELLEVK